MSDHDDRTDPLDQAYVEAEAMLSDEAARAARRARVLAAVASAPEAATPAPPGRPRPAWRRAGWLAAACAAGLGVLITSHVYAPRPPLPAPPAEPAAAPETARTAPEPPALVRPDTAPPPAAAASRDQPPPATAARPQAAPVPPPPLQAFPAAPPPVSESEQKAAAPPADETGRLASGADNAAADAMQSRARREAAPALAAPQAAFRPGPAARLRAAAAAGRTREMEALLDQGAPVDTPDAEGDTALMHAIQADQPAAAALLRRRGASLDRRNHAGLSARDLAADKDDAAMDEALGLER